MLDKLNQYLCTRHSDWNGLRLDRVTDGANQVACSNEATVTIVKPLNDKSAKVSIRTSRNTNQYECDCKWRKLKLSVGIL